jgi:hypothetical protein
MSIRTTNTFTTPAVAARFNVGVQAVRRAADAIGDGHGIFRVGLHRAIPESALPAIEQELRRRGIIKDKQTAK